MVIDIYSMRIGTAQRNISVLTRILEGTWDNADMFEFRVLLRIQVHVPPAEQLPFIERVRTHSMNDEDKKRLDVLISDEQLNLRNAQGRHRHDVASGAKY